jgi:uncharacterized metal-binding protein YceD (DUF177 family)
MDPVIPEFSRPVAVDRLGAGETRMEVTATAAECAALAERYRILAVESLTARLRLRRIAGSGLIRLKGELSARVVQACVVTLDPVPQVVEERFEMLFGAADAGDDLEVAVNYDEEDPPEPILHGMIDVGEAVAEHLALGLDPFPRRDGVIFESIESDGEDDAVADESPKPSPFAALAALKQKDG